MAGKKRPPKRAKGDQRPNADLATSPGSREPADSLLGQTWKLEVLSSTGSKDTFYFVFKGVPAEDDEPKWRWIQRGAAVAFGTTSARYVGRLQDGAYRGTGGNTKNRTWTWTATSVEAAEAAETIYQDAEQPSA